MLALLLLLSSSPLLLCTDHGVIILGGEGPDGPLDTVAVLTESGWCPPENIIIPPLPLAATGLTAHHTHSYLVLCGFPGETSCFQISPLNGHFVWTPVGVEDEDINMDVLEYVHSYDNMIKNGISSMWLNKNTGEYEFLWSPMVRNGDDAGFEEMAGWYRDQVPNLPATRGPYVNVSCLAQHPLSDGYPSMVTLSGGMDAEQTSLSDLLLMSNVGAEWQWHDNSVDIGQPRTSHSCLSFDYLGESGLLLVGGYQHLKGAIAATTLGSSLFFYAEYENHEDLGNVFDGLAEMNDPRSTFGLANWGNEGLVALGGIYYGLTPGQPTRQLLDSVEVWDRNENTWSMRTEWTLDAPRAGFGIVAKGSYSEVHGSDYCNME